MENKNNLKESPFSGEEFFKSTRITEEGKILNSGKELKKEDFQKAIPTMQKQTKKVLKETKEMPKGFEKFKKKIEKNCAEIDSIIRELIQGTEKPEQYGELLDSWGKFKNQFSWKINDKVQGYDTGIKGDSESERNKNRIVL